MRKLTIKIMQFCMVTEDFCERIAQVDMLLMSLSIMKESAHQTV